MAKHYSNPSRESDPHALPDVEVFMATWAECPECSRLLISDTLCVQMACPDCDRQPIARKQGEGWFYWYCFPGCLPDSEPSGPFATEAEALAEVESLNRDAAAIATAICHVLKATEDEE